MGAVASIATIPATYIYRGFVKPIVLPLWNKITASPPPPYVLEITEEEKEKLTTLRQRGADSISEKSALTEVGGQRKREPAQIKDAIMTRFGMVLASQTVAGTINDKHDKIGTVIGSLTAPEDSDYERHQVLQAISAVNPAGIPPFKVTDGEHAAGIGGQPEIVTAFERDVIKKLVESPEVYRDSGLNLTKEEREQINAYRKNQLRSEELVCIMQEVGVQFGGYERVPGKDDYRKLKTDFAAKQAVFEKKLGLAGKAFQQGCIDLKDGEALYLETGLEGHAMQLVIRREGDEFKLSTYDSSGALENTTNKGSITGLLRLSRLEDESMRKNALSFKVPFEKLNSAEGLDYLTYLIRTKTSAGWAETHIEGNVRHTSMEEREQLGTGVTAAIRRLFALNDQAYVYDNYIKKFSSLASKDAPPQFDELLQRPQNTGNCFAKKSQSCELYELGKPIYKKVRLAMVIEQQRGLIADICGDRAGEAPFVDPEYVQGLRELEPEYLSPGELYDASMRLTVSVRPNTPTSTIQPLLR